MRSNIGKKSETLLCAQFAGERGLTYQYVHQRYETLLIDYQRKKGSRNMPTDVMYKPGAVLDVKVEQILHYGARIRTLDGSDTSGLLHISEVTNGYVNDITDFVNVGDTLKVKVIPEPCSRLAVSLKAMSTNKVETLQDVLGDVHERVRRCNTETPVSDKVQDVKDKLYDAIDVLDELQEDLQDYDSVKAIREKLADSVLSR